MGIQVEFNPDLALRKSGTPGRDEAECIPENLEVGKIYEFLKNGQRDYWLRGQIPLCETDGKQNLSRPLASILILEATHFATEDNCLHTKGKYLVYEVYNPEDPTIHFEGMNKIR